ncbi:hypothetical protein Taro_028669 [Colocasia esculenta]|uniref:WRKY domain-containing protein n=1 Tax=Colocasia esculenta TaxID=4460 RepID=A0A843VNT5_COLES|nr:hypothetical protein [Colocasia esculenta]
MEDDGWDLQAVVKGCCGPARAAAVSVMADPFSSFHSVVPQEGRGEEEDDLFLCFPELFATRTALHELEELCKPFVSKAPQQQQQLLLQQQLQRHQQQLLLSPQRSPSSCLAAPLLPACGVGAAAAPPVPQQQQIRQPQHRPVPQNPRSKRRKNQQKRVVCQVPADGLSSDMWAWRKYGQKPIKGSPYPRGYYRCSSSKGCLARKQVERSRADPAMFVITYTGEHNHPVPTHRNSLAGSTRQKFPPSSAAAAAACSAQQANPPAGGASDPEQANSKAASSSPLSSPTAAGLSPTTPLASSVEDEVEGREDDDDLLLVGDMEMLGEEDVMFMDLGELRNAEHAGAGAPSFGDGLPDHFGALPPPWMGAATAAGGS